MKLVRQRPRGVDGIVVEDVSRVTRDLADASRVMNDPLSGLFQHLCLKNFSSLPTIK